MMTKIERKAEMTVEARSRHVAPIARRMVGNVRRGVSKPLGVEASFRKIAELSGGAYGRFDAGAGSQPGELLRAAAVFAVGGATALKGRKDASSLLLRWQLRGGS